jgi:hypothetical protein
LWPAVPLLLSIVLFAPLAAALGSAAQRVLRRFRRLHRKGVGTLLHHDLALDDAMGLVLVVDPGEPVGQPRALNQGLVPHHAFGVGLPRPVKAAPRRTVNLVQILPHDDRVIAVLAVDHNLHPYRAGLRAFDRLHLLGAPKL